MTDKKIGILDFGAGNIFSICNALENFTTNVVKSNDPDILKSTDTLILPGVGSFRNCITTMRKIGLDLFIHEYIATGKHILGICLGMHILLKEGNEDGYENGLNVIDGSVNKIKIKNKDRLPHIGWNDVYGDDMAELKIFKGIKQKSDFYFVHSYQVNLNENLNALYTNYAGQDIIAAFEKDNVNAVQFHPEKSQIVGTRLLQNFINL